MAGGSTLSDGPFIPFYTSDFLGGTGGMTASVKGVYITIICLIYEQGGPLPQQWDSLARRCGCTLPAFKRAIETLCGENKVSIEDGKIWSEKCAKHIASRRERQRSASAAAKSRWEKSKQKQGKADATALQGQCQPEPEPYVEREAKASPKKTTGYRLPDDWVLPLTWGQWAVEEGLPESLVRKEADKFRDYWRSLPGQKARKTDWKAVWRNWVRKALEDRPRLQSIDGGSHERPSKTASKSQDRVDAFVAGARGS